MKKLFCSILLVCLSTPFVFSQTKKELIEMGAKFIKSTQTLVKKAHYLDDHSEFKIKVSEQKYDDGTYSVFVTYRLVNNQWKDFILGEAPTIKSYMTNYSDQKDIDYFTEVLSCGYTHISIDFNERWFVF